MRILLPLAVLAVLFAGCTQMTSDNSPAKIKPGQSPQVLNKTVPRTFSVRYLLYLPPEYGRAHKKWPLILFLHGRGERGDDLNLVKKHGPPKILAEGRHMPFVVVSPQCPDDRWWHAEPLLVLLDEILATYDVDPDRVYLTGLSMGGFGAWDLATFEPNRFAAIAPICGGGRRYTAEALKHLPVWAFHGAKDDLVPPSESLEMVEAIKAAGGDAKLTVYPNVGHDSWTETYDNPKLYEWFLSHKR